MTDDVATVDQAPSGLSRPAPSRYRVIRQLGAGAMGVVWEAEDTHLQRRVALKFVRPDAAGERERRARLFREARAMAQLRHPNVVAVHDVGETGDELFLALELVVGTNARAWRDAAPRTTGELLAVWRQAGAGIAAVHRAGLVHRDIKPDNVFVADDGRVLVGDFGLATGEQPFSATASTQLTVSGAVIGTPLYMAPEQLLGDGATAKSDQFALCVSIWEALAGARPFTAATLGALVLAMQSPPAPPSAGDRRIFGVLTRGLELDPARRWPDVDALLAALEPAAPARRRPLAIALSAAGIAAAATAAVLIATRSDPPPSAPSPPPVEARASADLARPPPVEARASADLAPPPPVEARASADPAPPPPVDPTGSTRTLDRTPPRSGSAGPRRAGSTPPDPAPPHRPALRDATPAPAPAPAPAAPALASWPLAVQRAIDQMNNGQGAECLKLLAGLPEDARTDITESVRASCTMQTGDCTGARASLETYARSHGWAPDRIEATAASLDTTYCPIDAPPASRWVARAHRRLQALMASTASCKPVLSTMHRRGIALDNPKEQAFYEATCLVRDRDCAGARVRYREWIVLSPPDPGREAELDRFVEDEFVKRFPQCR